MKRLMFTVMAVGLLLACGGGSTDTPILFFKPSLFGADGFVLSN